METKEKYAGESRVYNADFTSLLAAPAAISSVVSVKSTAGATIGTDAVVAPGGKVVQFTIGNTVPVGVHDLRITVNVGAEVIVGGAVLVVIK